MPNWQLDLDQTLTEVQSCGTQTPSSTKTVYITRHAESESNVAKKTRNVIKQMQVGFDAPLSLEGRRQLHALRPTAQDIRKKVQGVLLSPLQRARQTALVLFGDEAQSAEADNPSSYKPPPDSIFWREVKAMKEIKPKEHAQRLLACSESILQARVKMFMSFLQRLPWDCFALVGHSKFFRTMFKIMGVKMIFENAVFWKVVLHTQDVGLRCISYERIPHPFDLAIPEERYEGIELTVNQTDTPAESPRKIQGCCA
jgi:broad specificity phosphatase PhoE